MEVALSPSAAVAPAPATAAATFSTKSRFFIKLPESRITCNIFPVSIKLKSEKKKRHSPSIDSAFNPDNLLVCSNAIASSSYSPPSFSFPSSSTRTNASSSSSIPSTIATLSSTTSGQNHHWMVAMEAPPKGVNSKPEIIDYYVRMLQSVLGSEKDAQMCIYGASWDTYFGFCCDIDEETSRELARLPGVLSVKPDQEFIFAQKDCSNSGVLLGALSNKFSTSTPLFPLGNSKHWLVKTDKHAIGVVSKAQMVDYYTQLLAKVMRNKKDAQMCIYHISWQSDFGFCCELDEDCARELAGVRGVLSVQPDENFASNTKDYGGTNSQQFDSPDSSTAYETTNMKTKKLFVTGLSFYTSEKTLRAAFEGFGEVVEARVIMDKISKRSKGYAFVKYTREEAAAAALKEMNGKIINGWMITVDVAKSTGQLRPTV